MSKAFASITIDTHTAPGARVVNLVANVGKQVASFGNNGLARGPVEPDAANGRITVRAPGIYRVELFMSFESDANTLQIDGHIAVNGINTHLGIARNVFNALGQETVACADHLQLDKNDTISFNIHSSATAILTIDHASLIVTKV